MKATTLEQSKKLAEILPIESADMYWLNRHIDLTEIEYEPFIINKTNKYIDFFKSYAVAVDKNEIIPCWSLAALLDIIRKCCERFELTLRADKRYNIFGTASNDFVYHSFDEHPEGIDNPVDACYEMILKLKEEGLL